MNMTRFCRCLLAVALLISPILLPAQIQNGALHPRTRKPAQHRTARPRVANHKYTCGSPPCVLPNVQVSADETNTPLIASSPTNPSLLAASTFDFSECNYITLSMASLEGGSQWQYPNCVSVGFDGNPTLAYGRKSLYNAGFENSDKGTYIQASRDDGQFWGGSVEVTAPIFYDGVTNVPWVAVDNSKTSQFANAVYLSVTQFDDLVVESEITASRSTDGGKSWSTVTVDPVQYKPEVDQFSRLAVGMDGTVYLAWQRCAMTGPEVNCADTQADMLLSKSTDGGETWSSPVTIATVTLVPDSCRCSFFGNLPNTNEPMPNMPVLAIDNSTGKYAGSLYGAMYNWTGSQMLVEVATSTDGGSTWGTPVLVAPANETHDQFFPTIAVSSTGVLGVGWLDRRNDPLNVSYQPFAAVSTDGGASFGTNYQLAKNLSDPYLDGQGGADMGTNIGAAWSGTNFLVTWPDTRSLQYMQDYVGGLRIK